MNIFIILGSLNAFLAVSLDALGTHALKTQLTAHHMLAVYQTSIQYHLIHSIGLLCIGILVHKWPTMLYIKLAGWSLALGIVLFSGSLYVLSISGTHNLSFITPFGGFAFLLGWMLLTIAAFKA